MIMLAQSSPDGNLRRHAKALDADDLVALRDARAPLRIDEIDNNADRRFEERRGGGARAAICQSGARPADDGVVSAFTNRLSAAAKPSRWSMSALPAITSCR